MKVYLWDNLTDGWKLYTDTTEEFHQQLINNNIFISQSAKIGEHVKIADEVQIKDGARIGNYVRIHKATTIGVATIIGEDVEIGMKVWIGNHVRIHDNVVIRDFVRIKDYAEIKRFAEIDIATEIGSGVKIHKGAKVPRHVKIAELEVFSKENIYLQLGLLPDENSNYTMYKSVRPDLSSFYDKTYTYKIGGEDSMEAERDQEVSCGKGWHFTNLANAIKYANNEPHRIISAQVNLKDILAVHDKVRVRKYKNVQEVYLNFL